MIVLHTGISVRYLYLRFIRRKKVTYSELKNGISNKANQDDMENVNNEFANRAYGCGFLMFVVLVIVLLSRL
jgi:hypothetical protein